jgi:poly(hydroxyalkanoate) granule-associated protein
MERAGASGASDETRRRETRMVKKLNRLAGGDRDSQLAGTIRESAQQIWLAGLGAFAKAQEEGVKVFDALVKEGKTLETRTRSFAQSGVGAVTNRVGKAAGEASAKATATWDKLEQVFEDRVARALGRLGVPTSREIEALAERVEQLTASVQRLSGAQPAATRPRTAGKAAKKKTASKARKAAKAAA